MSVDLIFLGQTVRGYSLVIVVEYVGLNELVSLSGLRSLSMKKELHVKSLAKPLVLSAICHDF